MTDGAIHAELATLAAIIHAAGRCGYAELATSHTAIYAELATETPVIHAEFAAHSYKSLILPAYRAKCSRLCVTGSPCGQALPGGPADQRVVGYKRLDRRRGKHEPGSIGSTSPRSTSRQGHT